MDDLDWSHTEVVLCIDLTCEAVTGTIHRSDPAFSGVQITLAHFDKFLGELHRTYILTAKSAETLADLLEVALYLIRRAKDGEQ